MALTNPNGGGSENLDLYLLKLAGLKVGETTRFTVTRPVGEKQEGKKGEYEKLSDTNYVSGDLYRAKIRKYEYEGEEKIEVQLYLKDSASKQMYIMSFNPATIPGRGILNSLINLDGPKGGKLEFSLYNDKKTGYAKVGIKYDGNKASWKYDIAEQNKHVTESSVTLKGKTKIVKDYFKLDEKLLNEFTEKIVNEYGAPAQFADAPVGAPDVDRLRLLSAMAETANNDKAYVDPVTGLPF